MGWLKGLGIALFSSCAVYAVTVNNPIMYVDSPDPSIVRVDDAYYMVTTTMHFAPGVPVFKSTDLAQSQVNTFPRMSGELFGKSCAAGIQSALYNT